MTNVPMPPMPPDRSQTAPIVASIIALSLGLLIVAAGAVQLVFDLRSRTNDFLLEQILIPLGLLVAIGGIMGLRRVSIERYIDRHGVDGEAQVLEVGFTQHEVDGAPVVKLHLRVTVPDKPPYEVRFRWTVRTMDAMKLVVGNTIRVKVHPSKHREVRVA